MNALIVAAPRILNFEKTNESIAFRLKQSGKKSLTLINDNEFFYNTAHKLIENDVLRNPRANKSITKIENILQIFFRSNHQNIIYTSKINLGKNYLEQIKKIDEITKEMPRVLMNEEELAFFIYQIGDQNLFEAMHSVICNQYLVTEINNSINLKKEFIILNLKEYYRYYFLLEETIKKYNIDEIVIYNGRMVRYAAAYKCAKNIGLKNIKFYESTSTHKDAYIVFKKPINHIKSISNEIKKSNKNFARLDFGYIYLSKRFSGGSTGEVPNFAKNRFSKNYNHYWDKFYEDIRNKKIVSIFTSSEFEKNSLKQNRSFSLNKTALEDLEYILKKNLIPSDYKILLRVHPHLSGIRSDINYQKKVQKLANKYNILYIGSDIPIDSYRLICASELCITFGSTIGAEAALLRTKSLCIGVGLYDKFNCVFIPKSFKEIEEFIKLKVSENYLNDMQSNAIEFFTKLNAFSIPYPKNISTMFMKYLFLKKIVFYFLRRNYRIKEFFYYLFKLNFKALRLGYGLRHNIIHNKNEPFKKPLYD